MSLINKPVFSNIMDFGAKANGNDKDSEAIKKAVENCKKNGGGTIYFPAGTYLTGAIHLCSNITLYIESGALIKFSSDFNDYPPVKTRWEGIECYGFSPLVYAYNQENITITGRGILEGQGQIWWDEIKNKRKENRLKPESEMEIKLAELNPDYANQSSGGGGRETQFLRPPLIQFMNCKNILIEGVTLQNSPFWNTHPVYCDNLTINNVTFKNPPDAPNTDGLDIDSCKNVKVSNCLFDVGDDCLCLKSGVGDDGIRVGKPTENVVISNCNMLNGHGGIVIGSETAGGIKNITISNCVFIGTDRGFRVKTRRGRAGILEDINISDIIMNKVLCPIVINMFYKCGAKPDEDILFSTKPLPINDITPQIKNMSISNITARDVKGVAAFIYGIPERPIENLRLINIEIELDDSSKVNPLDSAMSKGIEAMKGRAIWGRFLKNCRFSEISIISKNKHKLSIENSRDIYINGKKKH